jgi:hypothetical protein
MCGRATTKKLARTVVAKREEVMRERGWRWGGGIVSFSFMFFLACLSLWIWLALLWWGVYYDGFESEREGVVLTRNELGLGSSGRVGPGLRTGGTAGRYVGRWCERPEVAAKEEVGVRRGEKVVW